MHARTTLRRGSLFHELLPGLRIDLVVPAAENIATVTANGAAMLVRRSAFLELGGFDETFFMDLEDLDLCWRAWLRGWGSVYVPDAWSATGSARSPPGRAAAADRLVASQPDAFRAQVPAGRARRRGRRGRAPPLAATSAAIGERSAGRAELPEIVAHRAPQRRSKAAGLVPAHVGVRRQARLRYSLRSRDEPSTGRSPTTALAHHLRILRVIARRVQAQVRRLGARVRLVGREALALFSMLYVVFGRIFEFSAGVSSTTRSIS